MKKIFTETFKKNKWGSSESFSGVGSQLNYTYNIRTSLERIIYSKKINTVFDCSCGDWNWMKHVDLSRVKYTGNDIVTEIVERNSKLYSKENINFTNNDCLSSLRELQDKSVDLVICRHTLEHLGLEYSIKVCEEIRRVSNYALITSSNIDSENYNLDLIPDGFIARQINLQAAPFLNILGDPSERIMDTRSCPSSQRDYQTGKFNGINFYNFSREKNET
jgi:hypothetical protein